MDFISKLREKPVAVRRQIALFVTAGFTLIVIAIWAATGPLSSSYADETTGGDSPFAAMKSGFANVMNAFTNEKEAVKNSFNFEQ